MVNYLSTSISCLFKKSRYRKNVAENFLTSISTFKEYKGLILFHLEFCLLCRFSGSFEQAGNLKYFYSKPFSETGIYYEIC